MQVQTMDAFFKSGIIDDAVLYLKHIPDAYISGKEELIRELEKRREQAALSSEVVPEEIPEPMLTEFGTGVTEPMGQLKAALENI